VRTPRGPASLLLASTIQWSLRLLLTGRCVRLAGGGEGGGKGGGVGVGGLEEGDRRELRWPRRRQQACMMGWARSANMACWYGCGLAGGCGMDWLWHGWWALRDRQLWLWIGSMACRYGSGLAGGLAGWRQGRLLILLSAFGICPAR
jgi:hypothetical protein